MYTHVLALSIYRSISLLYSVSFCLALSFSLSLSLARYSAIMNTSLS